MILFPGVLNVVYFWIADSFLKAKKDQEGAHEPETTTEEKSRPTNNDDDDDHNFELMEDEKEKRTSYQPAPWSTVPDRNNDKAASLV